MSARPTRGSPEPTRSPAVSLLWGRDLATRDRQLRDRSGRLGHRVDLGTHRRVALAHPVGDLVEDMHAGVVAADESAAAIGGFLGKAHERGTERRRRALDGLEGLLPALLAVLPSHLLAAFIRGANGRLHVGL